SSTRIEQGLAVLRTVGLEPVGFVPPAWLAAPGLNEVVRDAGLAFVEDQNRVQNLVKNGTVSAPATCWSTRQAWRAVGSVAVAPARLRIEGHHPVVRVAFHPPDADSPAVFESCRRTLGTLLQRRALTDYRELLGLESRSLSTRQN